MALYNSYTAERIIRSFGIHPSDFQFKTKSYDLLYNELVRITGKELPWGMFTGVRPVKFIRENRGIISEYRIHEDKLALTEEIIAVQELEIPDNMFNLYIGIPFCPSRCKYCSFVSEAVSKSHRLVSEYIDCLLQELRLISKSRSKPYTIYIGGGTPTAIPIKEQQRIYETIRECFDLSGVMEYTVEAGRPETLSDEVLSVIKQAGATRISINPQSMNDDTLRLIGRGHTVHDVMNAYEAAGRYGFCINMDLISGLPNDDIGDSLERVIKMNPENITVHSLAKKRGAGMTVQACEDDLTAEAYNILKKAGYFPYYLYRLRECVGDNIGYSREKEHIGLYNVQVMDRSNDVIAAGCNGASLVGGVKHYNFKYPYEYVARFSEVIGKWEGLCYTQ